MTLLMTLSAPWPPQTTQFSAFCTAIHSFVTGEPSDFKFGTLTHHSKSHPADEKSSLSGRGQGHVNNFHIVDLENFATASRRYTGDINNSSVVGLFMTPIGQRKRLDRVTIECTCLLQIGPPWPSRLYNFDLFRTCRTSTSSFCTVPWQLARFQLTRRIARSLCDSWASRLISHGIVVSFLTCVANIVYVKFFSVFRSPKIIIIS